MDATTASRRRAESTERRQGEGGRGGSSTRSVAARGTMLSTPGRTHTMHALPTRCFLVTANKGKVLA
jgi:hypothetical protein